MAPTELVKRSEATTFAPCHVSAFFVPRIEPKEPAKTGSWGAGLCLATGVVATVEAEAASEPSIQVTRANREGEASVTREALRQLLGDRGVQVACTVHEGSPTGQGFGISGSSALASAFALARCLGDGRSDALRAAHLAEVRHRTGLSDVAASFLGGAVLRTKPGLAPYGTQTRLPARGEVVVATVGEEVETSKILRDPDVLERITEVGQGCLERVAENPTLEAIFREGALFDRETGIVDETTLTAIDACAEGGVAMAAMLGNTVVAYGDTEVLTDVLASFGDPHAIPIDDGGLRLFDKAALSGLTG